MGFKLYSFGSIGVSAIIVLVLAANLGFCLTIPLTDLAESDDNGVVNLMDLQYSNVKVDTEVW